MTPGDPELSQLRMVWPTSRNDSIPKPKLPIGYLLRTYLPGDEPRFFEVMSLAGWPGWNVETLQPWLAKVIPEGWFMVIHEPSDQIVCTAMALHNYKSIYPFWGELGWLAGDPEHSGKGLGLSAAAAVVKRLISGGYRSIQLFTEDYRLPAIRTYLRLGFVPSLYLSGMNFRWRELCTKLDWPFEPELWPTNDTNA